MRGRRYEVVPPGALLEGPVYDGATGTLLWTDILGRRLCWQDFDKRGPVQSFEFEDAVGFVALTDQAFTALVGVGGKMVLFNWRSQERREFPLSISLPPQVRWNDSRPGPNRLLYAGAMDRKCERPLGGLFIIRPDGAAEKIIPTATVSNGMGWSKDRTKFWWTDSALGAIFQFEFNERTGRISNGVEIFDVRLQKPTNAKVFVPDGLCVDSQNMIWLAVYSDVGPGRVFRIDPEKRKILATLELPKAPKVTCPAFVGVMLDRMVVTKTCEGLDAPQLDRYPDSGGMFICKPKVAGSPVYKFALPEPE